jgi:hypothetical protein
MQKPVFMILLIPVLGLLAGLAAVWGEIPSQVKTGGIVAIVIIAGGRSLRSRSGSHRSTREQVETKVIGARYIEDDRIGEFTIEASSSTEVSRLQLPRGSKISTVSARSKYRVEFPAAHIARVKAAAAFLEYRGPIG